MLYITINQGRRRRRKEIKRNIIKGMRTIIFLLCFFFLLVYIKCPFSFARKYEKEKFREDKEMKTKIQPKNARIIEVCEIEQILFSELWKILSASLEEHFWKDLQKLSPRNFRLHIYVYRRARGKLIIYITYKSEKLYFYLHASFNINIL